ncbi:MAG: ubiquitin-activating E1 FCCH domain-containing protein [Candidatus Kariarchaeaceae archaeon]|jgi:hypothetical protein
MAKTTPIQTNFTAGEWSPKLDGRTDVARYSNGVSTLENFIVAPFGGGDRRPGSMFVAPAKFPAKKCRLIPFEFSTLQSYVIEFGEGYLRFYRDNAPITEADVTITGATQADPVVITSAAHGYSDGDEIIIQNIVGMTELNNQRFIVTNSTAGDYELFDLDGGSVDGTGFGAYVSGGDSNKIVEISGFPHLESQLYDIQFAQTADILYVVHRDVPTYKLVRSSDTSWSFSEVAFTGGPFQPDNLDTTLTMTPSATTGAGITMTASSPYFNADMVGALLKYGGEVSGVQGYVEIVGFTSTTIVTADVIETLDATSAKDDWAIGSFSVDAGYPQAVGFHEQRLWLGGTLQEPQTVFASKTLEFENFTAGPDDNESLNYEIATEQVNAIRWISTGRGLAVGTSGGAFIFSSGADFIALTPSNVSVRRETNFGSELIIPKRIGNFLYYVQRGKRKMREFAYNFDIDSHKSLDMTLLSEQISDSGIINIDFQQSPNSVLWCVRTDGQIATMARQQAQEVIAWSRQITGATLAGAGSYESVAVIPTSAEEDQVWTSVKRTVNGTTRRFIEYFSTQDFGTDVEDAFFVDCGLTYTGASTSILSNLNHLEGETVQVLNEGAVEPPRTVTNGQITLDNATTKAHVGLGFTSTIKTLKLEGGSQLGTAQGKIHRVHEVTFRFYRTVGANFGALSGTNEIFFRNTDDMMDTKIPLFTGDKREEFPGDYTRDPRIYITQTDPLPMSVLAIIPRYQVFEQ